MGAAELLTSTEQRALELLGSGNCSPVQVAAALGVSESRISQLLSEESFAIQVAELRFKNLQSHTVRDRLYDELEDELILKLKDQLSLMFQPALILKAIQVINAAKRRGASSPEQLVNNQTVVQLILPMVVKKKYVVNVNNSVVAIPVVASIVDNQPETAEQAEQTIETIQSGILSKLIEKKQNDNGNKALEGVYRKVGAG